MNRRGAVQFETTDLEREMPGLADRMAPRKEALYRWLTETPDAKVRQTAVQGMIAATDAAGTRVLPWHQSATPPGTARAGELRHRGPVDSHTWTVPVLRKRTLEERIQSMVSRILTAPEPLRERLIAEAVGEYWKVGMPVTHDALRAVASKFLNAADKTNVIRHRG